MNILFSQEMEIWKQFISLKDYRFRELILLKWFIILVLSLLFLLYIASNIPLMSVTHFNLSKTTEELRAWSVYH